MDAKVAEMLTKERKRQRDLLELQKLKEKLTQLKNPDVKLLASIEKEIAALQS